MHHEGCKKITFCIQIFKGSPIGRSSFLDELCQYVVRIARANFFDRHFFIRHFFMFVVGFLFFANETIRIYWICWSRTEHTVWRLGPYILILSVLRPHRSTTYIDAAFCYRRSSMVCLSVCYDRECTKRTNRSRCRLGCRVTRVVGLAIGTMY